ncbi:MAG: PP2C family protein-serine/threonine phosphatase [Solirubrobacteraceae bacterium]
MRAETPRRRQFAPVAGVLVLGLLVTGILTWISVDLYSNNEQRLLRLRAHDASALLAEAIPTLQTPLASAAALADATRGNRKKFMRFVQPYVGTRPAHPFVSMSLWRVGPSTTRRIAVVGVPPVLPSSTPRTKHFLGHAVTSPQLSVIGLLNRPLGRLGYAFSGQGTGPFVAYGESALPRDRYQAPQRSAAFSDLNYSVYLGSDKRPQNLLTTSARHLSLTGQRAAVRVPFGSAVLTLTVAARRPLGGSLTQRLPWVIGIVGVLLTIGAAVLTARLIDRRRHAELLAARIEEVAEENRRLFTEQRGIAQTLQRALLPEALPQVPGLEAGVRYEPGVEGVDIGGDWYDLIPYGEHRLLLVVGDVSGRGLKAATTMAALRYGVHAYAAQGDPPGTILTKLSGLVSVRASGQLATVLCALVDVEAHELTVASAGHLPPLLISNGSSDFVRGKVGVPIGLDRDAGYTPTTVKAPADATFVAFTDGLVERRGESIDAGLERLRSRAGTANLPLERFLTHLVDELRTDQAADDTAIAAIRWLG